MRPNPRLCIAFLAGRLISKKPVTSIYDPLASRKLTSQELMPIGFQMSPIQEKFLGRQHGAEVKFRIFHHEEGHYIDLAINGLLFKGYCYGTGSFFAGRVDGETVFLYDFGELAHLRYKIYAEAQAGETGPGAYLNQAL